MTELVTVQGFECEVISANYENIIAVRCGNETGLITKSEPHSFIGDLKNRYTEMGRKTAKHLNRRPNGRGSN